MDNLDDLNFSDLFVGNAIGAFSRALCDRMDEAVTTATKLSSSACYAIVQIGSEEDGDEALSIEKLRSMLNLEHSTVVRMIDRLQDQELVIRSRGSSRDQRQVVIRLTDTGELYFSKILDARRKVLNQMVSPLDMDEKKTMLELIGKLTPKVVLPGDDQHVVCRLCDLETCRQEICPVNRAFPEHFELPSKPFKRACVAADG